MLRRWGDSVRSLIWLLRMCCACLQEGSHSPSADLMQLREAVWPRASEPADGSGGGGGGELGAAGSEIVKVFESKRKNKTAALEHLIKTAQRIEREWDLGLPAPLPSSVHACKLVFAGEVCGAVDGRGPRRGWLTTGHEGRGTRARATARHAGCLPPLPSDDRRGRRR